MPDYHEILHIFGTVQSSELLLITRIGDLSPAIQQLRRVAADNEGKYPLLARWRLAELIGSHVARFLMLCNSRRTLPPIICDFNTPRTSDSNLCTGTFHFLLRVSTRRFWSVYSSLFASDLVDVEILLFRTLLVTDDSPRNVQQLPIIVRIRDNFRDYFNEGMFISETYQREKPASHSANCLESSDFCLSPPPLMCVTSLPRTVRAVYTSMQEWRKLGSVRIWKICCSHHGGPRAVRHRSSRRVSTWNTGQSSHEVAIPPRESLTRVPSIPVHRGTRGILQLLQPKDGESSRSFVQQLMNGCVSGRDTDFSLWCKMLLRIGYRENRPCSDVLIWSSVLYETFEIIREHNYFYKYYFYKRKIIYIWKTILNIINWRDEGTSYYNRRMKLRGNLENS